MFYHEGVKFVTEIFGQSPNVWKLHSESDMGQQRSSKGNLKICLTECKWKQDIAYFVGCH